MEDHFLARVGVDAVHVYGAERVAVLFSVVEVGPHLLCESVRDVVHSACARGPSRCRVSDRERERCEPQSG